MGAGLMGVSHLWKSNDMHTFTFLDRRANNKKRRNQSYPMEEMEVFSNGIRIIVYPYEKYKPQLLLYITHKNYFDMDYKSKCNIWNHKIFRGKHRRIWLAGRHIFKSQKAIPKQEKKWLN